MATSKTKKFIKSGELLSYDVVVNANTNGDPCTLNNPLPVTNVGSSNNIDLAAGLLTGYSHVNKFGYRNVIPNTFQTIWDGTSDYVYVTADVISVTADNTSADNGGTVEVQGLDESYLPVTEVLTIGGASSTNQFSRIFRALVVTANTGSTNVGVVRVKNNTVDQAIISAGAGQTLMALYTIPAGKTGYLLKVVGSIDANNDALFRIYTRPFNKSFNVKGQFGVFASGFDYNYPVPLKFEEKTDIQIKAKSQNNVGGGALFDIVLKDN